jgi:predicted CDP-diglyceride synthetase/phosphatidate cytidylyltransferase
MTSITTPPAPPSALSSAPPSAPGTGRPVRTRPPVAVVSAVALTVLVTAFGAYGAVYFTGLDGWNEIGLTFLVAYEFLTLLGLVSALAFARRSPIGHAGLVTYAVWMNVFTVFKVGYIHEAEAVPFAVVGLLILGLTLSRPARGYVGRR